MRDIRFKASLCTEQPACIKKQKEVNIFVTKGTSATFVFDLADRPYKFSDIKQLTFVFTLPSNEIWYIKMYTKEHTLDDHIQHLCDFGYDIINISLTEKETSRIEIFDDNNIVDMEVAISLDSAFSDSYTSIEQMNSFAVFDSSYSHILEAEDE